MATKSLFKFVDLRSIFDNLTLNLRYNRLLLLRNILLPLWKPITPPSFGCPRDFGPCLHFARQSLQVIIQILTLKAISLLIFLGSMTQLILWFSQLVLLLLLLWRQVQPTLIFEIVYLLTWVDKAIWVLNTRGLRWFYWGDRSDGGSTVGASVRWLSPDVALRMVCVLRFAFTVPHVHIHDKLLLIVLLAVLPLRLEDELSDE